MSYLDSIQLGFENDLSGWNGWTILYGRRAHLVIYAEGGDRLGEGKWI